MALAVERMYHGGVNADGKQATNGDAKTILNEAATDQKAVDDAMLCAKAFLQIVRRENKKDA